MELCCSPTVLINLWSWLAAFLLAAPPSFPAQAPLPAQAGRACCVACSPRVKSAVEQIDLSALLSEADTGCVFYLFIFFMGDIIYLTYKQSLILYGFQNLLKSPPPPRLVTRTA